MAVSGVSSVQFSSFISSPDYCEFYTRLDGTYNIGHSEMLLFLPQHRQLQAFNSHYPSYGTSFALGYVN